MPLKAGDSKWAFVNVLRTFCGLNGNADPRLTGLRDQDGNGGDEPLPHDGSNRSTGRSGGCMVWTMTQRRELLRLLFAGIAVKHVGYRNGPRVDPGRLVLTWAR